MKMTKRIFIALLVVSVIVSVFAFTASAAEAVSTDYDYILEYYEEPILFDYDFAGDDVDYSLLTNDDDKDRITSEFVIDESAPGGKYLAVTVPASEGFWEDVTAKNNVYFNWNASDDGVIDDFILHMTVSGTRGTGDEKQLPKIIVSVADVTFTDPDLASSVGNTLVAIDYRAGCFSYLKRTTNSGGDVYGTFTNTDFAVTEGSWYDVSIAYVAEKNTAVITITDVADPENTYTARDAYLPYSEIKNVRVGAHGTDGASARDSVMNFANLLAFGGKYDRTVAGLQADAEQVLLDMYADYTSETVSLEVKEYIADVAAKLRSYGFVTENEEVKPAYDELVKGIASYCNDKLAYYSETYDTLPTYQEKRDLVDDALIYVYYLDSLAPAKVPAEIAEELASNIELVNGLDTTLQRIEQDSIALVNAVGDNMSIDYDDYAAVTARYNELYQYGQFADPTYEGTEAAFVFYSTICEAKEEIEEKGNNFIANVEILNSGADFNTRAQAFLICKSNYCDNETYPGITEALSYYEYHYDTMSNQIEMAENFIKYVNKAEYADYVSAKQENLAEAKKYMGCLTADPYVGVNEAYEVYKRVKAEVEEQVKNAKLYIDAVDALDSLSGAALTVAIEEALELQKKGNVLGVEGVADANIKLDKIISDIELSVKYREYFIGLVDSVEKAAGVEELYGLLKSAKLAERDADPNDEAVKAASAKLAAAIADYNGKVAAINTEFAKASEVAGNTCGIGKGVNTVSDRVIALIKKFFDEE